MCSKVGNNSKITTCAIPSCPTNTNRYQIGRGVRNYVYVVFHHLLIQSISKSYLCAFLQQRWLTLEYGNQTPDSKYQPPHKPGGKEFLLPILTERDSANHYYLSQLSQTMLITGPATDLGKEDKNKDNNFLHFNPLTCFLTNLNL